MRWSWFDGIRQAAAKLSKAQIQLEDECRSSQDDLGNGAELVAVMLAKIRDDPDRSRCRSQELHRRTAVGKRVRVCGEKVSGGPFSAKVSNNDGSSWSGTKHHQKSSGTASAAKTWLSQCGANALIGCLLSAADLFLRSLSILIHKQTNHRTISTYCFHYLDLKTIIQAR
jgi:hypothetical protein